MPVHQKSRSVSHLQQDRASVERARDTIRCAGANKREDLAVVECAVLFHVEAIAAKDDKYLFSAHDFFRSRGLQRKRTLKRSE